MKLRSVIKEDAQLVAQTIIKQLGGIGRLKTMIGAYDISYDSFSKRGALLFKFRGSSRCNYCKITLDALDAYDLEFGKVKLGPKPSYKIVSKHNDIYFDQLIDVFESETGLRLSI